MKQRHEHDIGEEPELFAHLYREQILAEQVRQLYRLAPLGLFATMMNSLLVAFVMQDVMSRNFLVPWVLAILLITVLRGLLIYQFWKSEPEATGFRRWADRFIAGLVAIGAAWGSVGLFPIAGASIAHEVFIAFVLGGMAAGATSTFSAVRHAFAAFGLPTLLPLVVRFLLLGDGFHVAMAAMTTLFGFLLWRISLHNYSINRTSLLLRFENRDVIENLKQANEHVEGLNAKLRSEIEARLAAEADLKVHQEKLERTVEERTADLRLTNEQLKVEIEGRKQYEKELRESKESLEQAQKSAEAANIAKSEFLANMSHEMRTPLAGASGMIKLVLNMRIGEEERELLQMAKRSADSLLRIISDLLDFSRLEAGMMTFESKPFSIPEVVRSAIEVVLLNAAEKGINLYWSREEGVPEQVTGDEGRLRQVLVNLVGNAVKFTEGGEIEISVRRVPGVEKKDRGFIVFSVRDTGVGIPAEQLDRIFGRFTQVDSSLTRRHGGTGLGLALTREIVENMGGSIWAESAVGKGSTFFFTFPTDAQ